MSNPKANKTQDEYADAPFARMMNAFAAERGKQYMKETKRLQNATDAAVPAALRQRCLELIDRVFSLPPDE